MMADQPGYMTVCQLGRVTFGFTRNGFDTQLINLVSRGRREDYLIFQLRKEGEPERIVLIHVQDTRNTDLSSGGFISRQRFVIENTMQLIFIKVWNIIFIFFFADTALTTVTGYVLSAAGKLVNGQTTVVCAALTLCHTCGKGKFVDLVDGKHRCFRLFGIKCSGSFCFLFMETLFCDQGSSESTHDTCNVRSDSFTACNDLKTSKNRIIIKSTALYYDLLTKLTGTGYFNYFK